MNHRIPEKGMIKSKHTIARSLSREQEVDNLYLQTLNQATLGASRNY